MNISPPGRDRRAEFGDLFSKSLRARVVCSQAFAMLTSSAKSVCILAFVKSDNAKFHKRKTADGRPVFAFSAADAKKLLSISGVTHTAALRQLIAHGLIEQIDHGGLLGANGTASTFTISNAWKHWNPGEVTNTSRKTNIRKALEAKKAKKQTHKPTNQDLQVFSLEPGQAVYFYAEGGRRARKGTLLAPRADGWEIQGCRNADKFRAPSYIVPLSSILLIPKRRQKASHSDKEQANGPLPVPAKLALQHRPG